MFEVGFFEIVLIFGLALVVLGPEKLPKLAANIGRWVGRARAMARQFQEQLESEAESLKSTVSDVKSTMSDVKSSIIDVQSSVADVGREAEAAVRPPDTGTPPHIIVPEVAESSQAAAAAKPDEPKS